MDYAHDEIGKHAHSVVARHLNGPLRNRYVGYTAWRGVARYAIDPKLAGVTLGPGVETGHVPTGPELTYWFTTAVTFRAVQREADVSHVFLYSSARLRERIEHQRRQQRPAPDPIPTDNAGDNNIVAALSAELARLKAQHRAEVTALRTALKQAHGENLELRRELQRRLPSQQPKPGEDASEM
jgi:hypothetical protein